MARKTKLPEEHQPPVWVSVGALKIGMYVCALDRPWIEVPFALQGFGIRSARSIEMLKLHCERVLVDPNRSWVSVHGYVDSNATPPSPPAATPSSAVLAGRLWKRLFRRGDSDQEPAREETMQAELGPAKRIYSETAGVLSSLFNDIKKGQAFSLVEVTSAATQIVGSVARNPDALLWLSQLRSKDNYHYQHALNNSILMVAAGRQIMLPQQQLVSLATAGLVHDIGMVHIPDSILHKCAALDDDERRQVIGHVEDGIATLRGSPAIGEEVIQIMREHHERYDGSGYPRKLSGDGISLLGGIAGICDCYDAMISVRPHAPPIAPLQALTALYNTKGQLFQAALVEKFIRCIGIYPVGSLVLLNSQEVAIVIEQRLTQRLHPKVLVVLDENKNKLDSPWEIDLRDEIASPTGKIYSIDNVLEPSAYGLDPTDYYLFDP